jgi:hypothetical protein
MGSGSKKRDGGCIKRDGRLDFSAGKWFMHCALRAQICRHTRRVGEEELWDKTRTSEENGRIDA